MKEKKLKVVKAWAVVSEGSIVGDYFTHQARIFLHADEGFHLRNPGMQLVEIRPITKRPR